MLPAGECAVSTSFYRLQDLDLRGKKILIRVDFNVPMEGGKVADDFRLKAHKPTIDAALAKGAAVILASHLGRPDGKADPKYSLRPLVEPLSKILGKPVAFAADCVGPEAEKAARALRPGEILLLENLRFHAEEEKNDAGFAGQLAALADAYADDAFATSHRAHASVSGAAKAARQKAAGLLLEAEIDALEKCFAGPARPLAAVIGGAKISTKIAVLKALARKVDVLLIGGAMANTFLAALGFEMGKSLIEPGHFGTALDVLEAALDAGVAVELPRDAVCSAKGQEEGVFVHTCGVRYMTPELSALDIGPQTSARFAEIIGKAGTVIWNGPLGLFERDSFATGTLAVARALAASKALTVAGGGETVEALNRLGLAAKIGHVSTGGGAFLEWLEGKSLPGVEALRKG